MTPPDRRLLHALLRNDLASFTQRCFQTVAPGQHFLMNWHIEAIAHQLERCRRRETRRLLITLPPRNLKSICASVAFPAWVPATGTDGQVIVLDPPTGREWNLWQVEFREAVRAKPLNMTMPQAITTPAAWAMMSCQIRPGVAIDRLAASIQFSRASVPGSGIGSMSSSTGPA